MLSTKRFESSRLVFDRFFGQRLESGKGVPMRLSGFLMAFVCSATLFAAGQDDTSATQSRIVALEKAWNQAYKLGDRKALDELLEDRIVIVNDDGSMQNKAEFLASIKKSNSQEQQVTPESINVHVYGNSATATGVFRAKGTE